MVKDRQVKELRQVVAERGDARPVQESTVKKLTVRFPPGRTGTFSTRVISTPLMRQRARIV
jgi:hypothetical protein